MIDVFTRRLYGGFIIENLAWSKQVKKLNQKIDYIHKNPVRAGFVGSAHEFWYSSANPESPLKVIC
ncbi:MAG: hypothetical protein ACXVJD_18380 [Mucilaginibacter sp.]